MKLSTLQDQRFQAVFKKLGEAELNAKGLWKYKRIVKWLDEELKLIEETRVNLMKRFCELDAEGNMVQIKDKDGKDTGQVQFKEGKIEDFFKEFGEFLNNDLEVKVKFHFDELENAKLTGNDIIILDELVFEPE